MLEMVVFISPVRVWIHGFAYRISCGKKTFNYTAGTNKLDVVLDILQTTVHLHGLKQAVFLMVSLFFGKKVFLSSSM